MKAGWGAQRLARHAGNAGSLRGGLTTWPSPNPGCYSSRREERFLEPVHCTLPGVRSMYAGAFVHKLKVINRCLH